MACTKKQVAIIGAGTSDLMAIKAASRSASISFEMACTKKQVAVIGAGTSGLMAIKALKEENFEPFCFEKSNYFGGLWKYHEEDTEGVPSVMWSTSLNNSKESGAISDFPPDPFAPNYMRHPDVLKMFTDYGKRFDLFRHITYNQEVVAVQRSLDYNRTGRWRVVAKDTRTGQITANVYDAVMVCIGHLSLPNVPEYPGMDKFRGEIVHTHSVKKFQMFNGRRVCVVGTGSSALDASVEISHNADQVYLSVRTPVWISTRHGPYGYPLDNCIFTWDHNVLHKIFPLSWSDKFIKEVFLNPRFSHSLFNIHPKQGVSNRDIAVSDTISSRFMNGSVLLKKNIRQFTEDGVVFEDESQQTPVDTVVLGTGYKWDFPFLEQEDFVKEGSKVHLYKCVYPPHLPFPTLGIIGFLVPLGPGFPCVEMQCRWFVHNLAGRGRLPRKAAMQSHVDKQYRDNLKRYGECSRVYVHVDFMPYLEDLASEIVACPSMMSMLLRDFELFVECAIGPYTPYRFRLVGPHRWKGARQAILQAGQRMRAPLQGKKAFEKRESSHVGFYLVSTVTVMVLYLYNNNLLRINSENLLVLQRIFMAVKASVMHFVKTGGIVDPRCLY